MISMAHQQCGHHMMFCTNCHATGCDVSHCDNCIGNGNYHICKYCGARAVVSNFRRNEMLRYRRNEARALDQDTEHRLKKLEQHNNLRFSTATRNTRDYNFGSTFKWVIFFAVCWAISQVINRHDYDGMMGLVVTLINLIGAIAELPIAIIKEILF